jgi:hypothetical protein
MHGDPEAIAGRLRNVAPSRRWRSWIAKAISERRRVLAERLEVCERLAREERRALERGYYVPEPKYRYRP